MLCVFFHGVSNNHLYATQLSIFLSSDYNVFNLVNSFIFSLIFANYLQIIGQVWHEYLHSRYQKYEKEIKDLF